MNELTIKAQGIVSGYVRDARTKERIEGSEFEMHNTVHTDLLNLIAARLGADATSDIQFLQTGTGDQFDTIGLQYDAAGEPAYVGCQTVTKAAGGTGSVAWVEFRGVYTAASDLTFETALLLKNFSPSGGTYTSYWASAAFAKTVYTGQELVLHWKLTWTAA